MTTRERKIEFMREFGSDALPRAVKEAFYRNGPDWLTDEQLEDIVRDKIADLRLRQKIDRENRRRWAAKADGSAEREMPL